MAWWIIPNVVWGLCFVANLQCKGCPDALSTLIEWIWGIGTFSVLTAPIIAAVADGRTRTGVALVGSAWSVLYLTLFFSMQTSAWKRDDGLGQGIQLFFTHAIAFLYPVIVIVLFGLRRLLRKWARFSSNS